MKHKEHLLERVQHRLYKKEKYCGWCSCLIAEHSLLIGNSPHYGFDTHYDLYRISFICTGSGCQCAFQDAISIKKGSASSFVDMIFGFYQENGVSISVKPVSSDTKTNDHDDCSHEKKPIKAF